MAQKVHKLLYAAVARGTTVLAEQRWAKPCHVCVPRPEERCHGVVLACSLLLGNLWCSVVMTVPAPTLRCAHDATSPCLCSYVTGNVPQIALRILEKLPQEDT